MKRNILKELLSDAYDAWCNDQMTASEYHRLAEFVTAKADELREAQVLADEEWNDVYDENGENMLLVDDVPEL